jgi:hypothetical protein
LGNPGCSVERRRERFANRPPTERTPKRRRQTRRKISDERSRRDVAKNRAERPTLSVHYKLKSRAISSVFFRRFFFFSKIFFPRRENIRVATVKTTIITITDAVKLYRF